MTDVPNDELLSRIENGVLWLTINRADKGNAIPYYVRDGLIPNMFTEGESEGLYHTADATLWFFHAVARYLVMRGGIDVRRIHTVGMGKVVLAAGEKANNDTYAKARRVDIRLLSPQS